jgi:hypothetical protein
MFDKTFWRNIVNHRSVRMRLFSQTVRKHESWNFDFFKKKKKNQTKNNDSSPLSNWTSFKREIVSACSLSVSPQNPEIKSVLIVACKEKFEKRSFFCFRYIRQNLSHRVNQSQIRFSRVISSHSLQHTRRSGLNGQMQIFANVFCVCNQMQQFGWKCFRMRRGKSKSRSETKSQLNHSIIPDSHSGIDFCNFFQQGAKIGSSSWNSNIRFEIRRQFEFRALCCAARQIVVSVKKHKSQKSIADFIFPLTR